MEHAQPLDAHHRRRPPTDGAILRDPAAALEAIEAETTDVGVCHRLCRTLVVVVGATACTASRVDEAYLVGLTSHELRDVALGRAAAYRISDFPLTDEVLRPGSREPPRSRTTRSTRPRRCSCASWGCARC